jgi:hypothetical protein
MTQNKAIAIFSLLATIICGCTKLNENLGNSFTNDQVSTGLGAGGTALILQGAYVDLATPFTGQDRVFSLEENSTDESLVPTRGGDWDDNGVWRVVHNHTWTADHDQLLQTFNLLNKLNFDATNVLAFGPSAEQAAEARFLRAYSLYYLLDLFGQYPFRNPGDNLLNAPKVYTTTDGDSAVTFIINELNAIMPDLAATNDMTKANQDAAKVLLMRCYLNRGAFENRKAPTFAASDLQQVITLGNEIISSGKYSYMPEYFDNFTAGIHSTEGIFAYPNYSGVSANNSGIDARWMMTLHYNSYSAQAPNAGWNGFSTVSDFYKTFGALPSNPATLTQADSVLDGRIGIRWNKNVTPWSGLKPGMAIGQQYNAAGQPEKDRKGNPLAFDPTIASNMIETGSNLEVTGIRVIKYVPDFSIDHGGANYSANSGNWLMLMRYPEVVLMVAEAEMRSGDNADALKLVNDLRAARHAPALTSMTLVNTSNVDDPTTLLAETGRELYWESLRRTNLVRFGVFNVIWQYKPTDDPRYLVYPVPNQSLAANPNLKQNDGYN